MACGDYHSTILDWYRLSSIVTIPSRHELNRSTEEVVLAIKKAQLWAMLGHRVIGWHRGEFILKKHSYSIQEGLMQHHVEIELPEHIESAHTMKRVYFFCLWIAL